MLKGPKKSPGLGTQELPRSPRSPEESSRVFWSPTEDSPFHLGVSPKSRVPFAAASCKDSIQSVHVLAGAPIFEKGPCFRSSVGLHLQK